MRENSVQNRLAITFYHTFLAACLTLFIFSCKNYQAAEHPILKSQSRHAVGPYVDKDLYLKPLAQKTPRLSFYLQPWRGYLTTVPGDQFLAGIGVVYNLPPGSDHERAMEILSKAGFTNIRMEIPFGDMNWDGTSLKNKAQYMQILLACKKNNVKPLILLNSHHGYPCPNKSYSDRTLVSGGDIGSTSIVLSDVSDLKAGYSGLTNVDDSIMAGVLFTHIDPATRRVTLSKPLPKSISNGSIVTINTLEYLPFYPIDTPQFEDTMQGWVNYVHLVTDLLDRAGISHFEIEMWNELSFGSNYTNINNYYKPALFGGKQPDLYNPGGPDWEMARRTAQQIKKGYPYARVIWGFSNTSAYHTSAKNLPPGIDAKSYHPYGTSNENTDTDRKTHDNLNAGLYVEGYAPPGLVRAMPEGWAALGTKIESFARFLNPDARKEQMNADGKPILHYITEHGFQADAVGIKDTDPARAYRAKSLVRALLFWLNKGVDKMYIFCAWDPTFGSKDTGFGMLPADPDPKTYGSVTDDRLITPQLKALRNVIHQFDGAVSIPKEKRRRIDVDVVSVGKQYTVFQGDESHPPLYYRDMFAFLPYQIDSHQFVCGLYVMSYNNVQSPPPMDFEVILRNVKGKNAELSLYDPITDKSLTTDHMAVVKRTDSSVTIQLKDVPDYPWLLKIKE